MKFLPRKFNDLLAGAVLAALLAGWYSRLLPDDVYSAAVAWVALILNYYFRKSPPTGEGGR